MIDPVRHLPFQHWKFVLFLHTRSSETFVGLKEHNKEDRVLTSLFFFLVSISHRIEKVLG